MYISKEHLDFFRSQLSILLSQKYGGQNGRRGAPGQIALVNVIKDMDQASRLEHVHARVLIQDRKVRYSSAWVIPKKLTRGPVMLWNCTVKYLHNTMV